VNQSQRAYLPTHVSILRTTINVGFMGLKNLHHQLGWTSGVHGHANPRHPCWCYIKYTPH